jgi:hypothetical protein
MQDVPGPSELLSALDHPVMNKARTVAPAHPDNQKHVECIEDVDVFRFTHGRYRAATWLEPSLDILWVCAVDLKDSNTYDYFEGLHSQLVLLPTEDDYQRLGLEDAKRLVLALLEDVPGWVERALSAGETEHALEVLGGAQVILYARESGGIQELWLAMPTLGSPTAVGMTPQTRGLLVGLVQAEFGEGLWEERHDWPTRELKHYEIAHLGLR